MGLLDSVKVAPSAPPGYSSDPEKKSGSDIDAAPRALSLSSSAAPHGSKKDGTQRNLQSRHIQLIGIGGTVGTALFVNIGQGVLNGGPASLFLAFAFWCTFVCAVTVCMAEMVTWAPISSPFIRFAGRYVDEALGFAAGWNFFVLEASLVPFEIVGCNLILHYWTDAIPTAAVIVIIAVLYLLINVLAVRFYGETEFWAAIGKVLLAVGLIVFTFFVMVGANPHRDHFGFRYWYEPGAFKPLYYEGALGKWLGFLQCLIMASFTIAGPDYVSMAAGEAENPRKVLPKAYNAVFYRLTAFFVLGALCVGILVPSDSEDLANALSSASGAAASPYVLAMKRLDIGVLPHIVNAMLLTAAFSAGNSYVYCASRSLYGLALEGKAPRFLTICTRGGVPIYTVLVVLGIGMLAFLQLGSGSAVVLNWIVSLVTASQLLNFSVVSVAYLCWHRALKVQGIDRATLPYRSWWQPWVACYALTGTFVMVFVGGYTVFLPIEGMWNVPDFLFSYFMIFLFPALFIGWKLIHKTKFVKPQDIDLRRDLDVIDEYERNYVPTPPGNLFEKILDKLFG